MYAAYLKMLRFKENLKHQIEFDQQIDRECDQEVEKVDNKRLHVPHSRKHLFQRHTLPKICCNFSDNESRYSFYH